MKSTGEVLGLSTTYAEAMYKAILASGFKFPKRGDGVLLTVKDSDKSDLIPLADKLFQLGFELYGTGGTANYLNKAGIPTSSVRKIEEDAPNSINYIADGKIQMLVNTEANSSIMLNNGFRLRRICIERGIPTITSLDTLVAVLECIERNIKPTDVQNFELSVFAKIVSETRHESFPKNELPPKNFMLLK
jgi:carbamoyl-phosphate synthase large subunit